MPRDYGHLSLSQILLALLSNLTLPDCRLEYLLGRKPTEDLH